MFRSLLVPLDGSGFGEHALPLALAVARAAGAAIRLARVHEPVLLSKVAGAVYDRLEAHSRQQEEAYLEQTAQRVKAAGVTATTVLLDGSVAETLRQQTADCDLVVMATHGRGPLSRFWLGAVTDELVRHAAAPLLLVRPGEKPADLTHLPDVRHVLVPLDGSSLAEQALKPAVELARLMRSELILFHAVPPLVVGLEAGAYALMADPDLMRRLETEARQYLDQMAATLRGQGLTVRVQVTLDQHPAAAILDAAAPLPGAVIALATHGRGGLARLLLGSVADKVIRGAASPVLVCRPHPAGPGGTP